MIAGAAVGLAMTNLKGTAQLEFIDGPSLSIVTEGTDFKTGERILIRLINSGTVPIEFPGGPDDLRITQLDGMGIYSHEGGASVLGPGDELIAVWDQLKDDGEPVLYGAYRIIAQAVSEHQQTVKRSITINIFK